MAEWTGLAYGLNVGNKGKGRDPQFCELSNGIIFWVILKDKLSVAFSFSHIMLRLLSLKAWRSEENAWQENKFGTISNRWYLQSHGRKWGYLREGEVWGVFPEELHNLRATQKEELRRLQTTQKDITETMKNDLRGSWLHILLKPAVGQKLDEDLAKKKCLWKP